MQGFIGAVIEVTCEIDGATDISAATVKRIYLKPPGEAAVAKTASFTGTGTDGKIRWTSTAAADLDDTGDWQGQAYLEHPSYSGYVGIPFGFRVLPHL